MLLAFLASTALATTGHYPVRLTGGVVGVAGVGQGELLDPTPTGNSVGGGVVGRGSVHLRGPFSIEGAAREGWLTQDARSLGGLASSLRWTTDSGAFGRLGLAHHHEVPAEVVLENPLQVARGDAEGIRHRTGLEVGGGFDIAALDLPHPPLKLVEDRMGMSVDISANWFSNELGPAVYGFVEVLWWVEVGKRR